MSVIIFHESSGMSQLYNYYFKSRIAALDKMLENDNYEEARKIALQINNTQINLDIGKIAKDAMENMQNYGAGKGTTGQVDWNLSALYSAYTDRVSDASLAAKHWSDQVKALRAIKSGLLSGESFTLAQFNQMNVLDPAKVTLAQLDEMKLSKALGAIGESVSVIGAAAIAKSVSSEIKEILADSEYVIDITSARYINVGNERTKGADKDEKVNYTSRHTDNILRLYLNVNGEKTTLDINISDKAKKDFAKGFKKANGDYKKINFAMRSSTVSGLLKKYESYDYTAGINVVSLHISGEEYMEYMGAKEGLKEFLGRALFLDTLETNKINSKGDSVNDAVHFTIVGDRVIPETNIYKDMLANKNEQLKATIDGASKQRILAMRDKEHWKNTGEAESSFSKMRVTLKYSG